MQLSKVISAIMLEKLDSGDEVARLSYEYIVYKLRLFASSSAMALIEELRWMMRVLPAIKDRGLSQRARRVAESINYEELEREIKTILDNINSDPDLVREMIEQACDEAVKLVKETT